MKDTSDPMGELYQNKSFRILQSSTQPLLFILVFFLSLYL